MYSNKCAQYWLEHYVSADAFSSLFQYLVICFNNYQSELPIDESDKVSWCTRDIFSYFRMYEKSIYIFNWRNEELTGFNVYIKRAKERIGRNVGIKTTKIWILTQIFLGISFIRYVRRHQISKQRYIHDVYDVIRTALFFTTFHRTKSATCFYICPFPFQQSYVM